MTGHGGFGLPAAVLAAFRATRPDVVVGVQHAPGLAEVQHLVADGEADLAFAHEPLFRPELEVSWLATEPLWVAVPADHPAAVLERVGPGAVADLASVGPWSTLPRVLVDRWAGPFGAGRGEPPWGPDTPHLEDSLLAVAGGTGFFLVNPSFVDLFPRPGITYRPVGEVEPVGFGVTWRRGDRRADVTHLVETARRVAAGD